MQLKCETERSAIFETCTIFQRNREQIWASHALIGSNFSKQNRKGPKIGPRQLVVPILVLPANILGQPVSGDFAKKIVYKGVKVLLGPMPSTLN